MSRLEMKYFVLKPRSKNVDDLHAHASRMAMRAYADAIESYNENFAQDIRAWVESEVIRVINCHA